MLRSGYGANQALGVGDGVGTLGKGVGDTVSGKSMELLLKTMLTDSSTGATQGIGNTTKAVGDTTSGYVTSATGKKQTSENPLGL